MKSYRQGVILDIVEREAITSQGKLAIASLDFMTPLGKAHAVKSEINFTSLLPPITAPGQGVNIGMNVWHGVLTPLQRECDFLVVDRGGAGNNLEEHFFSTPFTVRPG